MHIIRVALAGGGSGGHTVPLLAVAGELTRFSVATGQPITLHYFGPGYDHPPFRAKGIQVHYIAGAKIRRYFSLANLIDIPKFIFSIIQALWQLYWVMPDAMFSKGGPGALPVVLAGWFYRIPILVHDSDSTPGVTNLISSWFARRIAVSFESAQKFFPPQRTAWVGSPIRADLIEMNIPQADAKERLGFNANEPLIFFFSGSQGSKRINEFILGILGEILEDTQVLHQTGPATYPEVEKLSKVVLRDIPAKLEAEHRYQAVPYMNEDLGYAYAACDLIIGRAGSSIFEYAAFGKPAILIPLLESANDHQRKNAYEFVKAGAGVIIEETNLLPKIFLKEMRGILNDPERKQQMSQASAAFFKPDGAKTIAEEVLRLAR